MKTGIGSYAFRYAIAHPSLKQEEKMTLTGLIDYCHNHNIEALQICDNIPLHKFTENQLQEGLLHAKKYELEIEIGATGFSFEHLKQYVEITRSYESKILRTVLNAKEAKENIDAVASQIKLLIPLLESYNITLAIENHFDLNPWKLQSLIKNISHPLVKICIDPLNSISLLWGENETFNTLKNNIVTAHVKDVKAVRKGAGFLITGCPVGEGIFNTENYLTQIYQANPNCNVFIEQWMDEKQTIPDTLSTEIDWVQKGIKYLKQAIEKIEKQHNII